MRFFKKPWFQRFAEKEGISDDDLKALVAEMEAGTIHASLGGYVYKQRLARKGAGKSGGYRTLLFFRSGERVFFMYPFTKSDRANITQRELVALKDAAKVYMEMTPAQLAIALKAHELVEF